MNNVSRELIKYHDFRKYLGISFILDASDKNDTSVLLDYNVKTLTQNMVCHTERATALLCSNSHSIKSRNMLIIPLHFN